MFSFFRLISSIIIIQAGLSATPLTAYSNHEINLMSESNREYSFICVVDLRGENYDIPKIKTLFTDLLIDTGFFHDVDKAVDVNRRELKKYVQRKLSAANKRSVAQALDDVDIIFFLYQDRKNRFTVELMNSRNVVLGKHQLEYAVNNISEKEITDLFSGFLNKYVYTSVEVKIMSESKGHINVNRRFNRKWDGPGTYLILNIPKMIDSEIHVVTAKEISHTILVKKISFSLTGFNRRTSQLDAKRRIYNAEFREKVPTAVLRISDQGADPVFDPELRIKGVKLNGAFRPDIQFTSMQTDSRFILNAPRLGQSVILLSPTDYPIPMPFITAFKDSCEIGPLDVKDIIFTRQSQPLAFTMNTILPGSGSMYMDGFNWKNVLMMTVYSLLVYESANYYDKFQRERENYKYWQAEYDSLDPQTKDAIYFSKWGNVTQHYYNTSKELRSYYLTFTISAVTLNIISNYLLKGRIFEK